LKIKTDMSNLSSGGRKTLRIVRLLDTRVRLLRLELVGQEQPLMSQVGALVLYGPFLAIGYAFLLAGLARVLARGTGWSGALFLMGAVHLALGAWGVRRARFTSSATSFEVVDPECAPPEGREAPSDVGAPGRRDTWISATPPRLTVAPAPVRGSGGVADGARSGVRGPRP
jgi:hypothetical protein